MPSYLVQRPGTGTLTPEAMNAGWSMLASGQIVPPSASKPSTGAAGGSIQQAIADATKGQKSANKANEQRYQQGLGILQEGHTNAAGLLTQSLADIANNGVAAGNRINQQEKDASGKAYQSSVSRGLTDTTIMDSLQRGVSRDANDARLSLEESQNSQRSGIRQQQANEQLGGTGNIANFIAARNDVGPNLGQLASLVQGAASDATGTMRSGSVTRQSVPGFGGSSGSSGLPSSFGSGGGSSPPAYSGPLNFTKGADPGSGLPIPGVTPSSLGGGGPAPGSIASILSGGGGQPGNVANLLTGGQSSLPPMDTTPYQSPNNVQIGGGLLENVQNLGRTMDKADPTPWMGSASSGYFNKAEWEALSPQQKANVLAGKKP
jgi:hypothetical protein